MNNLILTLPHLKIHNANALSSPYSIGFPAMTAWLGATHALQRHLQPDYPKLRFNSMAVVCHQINLQTHKGKGDYEYSIIATGNPLTKEGKRPSFIEEARCHLEVSLIIDVDVKSLGAKDRDDFVDCIDDLLSAKMKLAGGDIIKHQMPTLQEIDDDESHRRLMRQLMPGHCLIERRDLMQESMKNGQDSIDALLDGLKVSQYCEQKEDKITWKSQRQQKGWIVPIATGYQGISPIAIAENQRDSTTPHRFAESIITLGEFIMPYRITDLNDMLWHYHSDVDNNLYLCQQNTFKN